MKILTFILLLLCHAPAQAQISLPVALARVCVAEAGWHAFETGECAAIYQVVQNRARTRNVSELRALMDYAALHFDRRHGRRERRRWILGLTEEGQRPRGWPRGLDWQGHFRPIWLNTIEHARSVIRGEVPSVCSSPPDHWGGAMDDWRARRLGWHRVRCPGLRNHYWVVP